MSETQRESIHPLNPALDRFDLSPATLTDIYVAGRVSGIRSFISRLYISRNIRGDYFYRESPSAAGVTLYKKLGPRYSADSWRRRDRVYDLRLLIILDWR
jgi:hypothetical protein